jgi:hypothetical protein
MKLFLSGPVSLSVAVHHTQVFTLSIQQLSTCTQGALEYPNKHVMYTIGLWIDLFISVIRDQCDWVGNAPFGRHLIHQTPNATSPTPRMSSTSISLDQDS